MPQSKSASWCAERSSGNQAEESNDSTILAVPTVSVLRSGSTEDVEEEAGVLPGCDTLQRQRIKNTNIRKPIHFYNDKFKKQRGGGVCKPECPAPAATDTGAGRKTALGAYMATVPACGPRADWKMYSQEAQCFTATKLQTETCQTQSHTQQVCLKTLWCRYGVCEYFMTEQVKNMVENLQ